MSGSGILKGNKTCDSFTGLQISCTVFIDSCSSRINSMLSFLSKKNVKALGKEQKEAD